MTRARTHVFVGPSLEHAEASRLLLGAVLHPPVAHGDLLPTPLRPGDRVVIVDGLFHQTPSVRHKEILDVLRRGIPVFGTSSMGALRAAELAAFGMAGSGVVYRMFALGLLDADDEVAQLHDDESGGWAPRTVALVSVRVLSRRLRIQGVLTQRHEAVLVAAARDLPFSWRAWPTLLEHCRARGLPVDVANQIHALVRGPRTDWDVKALDAVRMLRNLQRPVPETPVVPSWPETGYVARWRHHPEDRVSMTVTAAQLYAEDYPSVHYRTVLRAIASEDDGENLWHDASLDRLEDAAMRMARSRGLVPRCGLAEMHNRMADWLSPGEHYADPVRLICRVLVRSHSWAPGLAPLAMLYDTLLALPGAAALNRLVDDATAVNSDLLRRGYPVEQASRSALRRLCLSRWNVRTLQPAAYDRGFIGPEDLYQRGQPLCALGILTRVPSVRLRSP